MTTRYIISDDDYSSIRTLFFQYVADKNIDKYFTAEQAIFKNKGVPANAMGYFVIDDDGNVKCVRFPK